MEDIIEKLRTIWDGEENIIPVVTNQIMVTESKVISLKGQEDKE